MDYRISKLESDVGRIRDELSSMSGRILDLELERERKRAWWESFFQVLLVIFSTTLLYLSIIAAIEGHPEQRDP